MIIHRTRRLHLYFGDAQDHIFVGNERSPQLPINMRIMDARPYAKLSYFIPVHDLMFLRQVHGTDGVVVKPPLMERPFTRDGDYLITNCYGIGIGVLTADCLPIVLYDTKNHAIAVVHAGWRSAVKKILLKALERMEQEFGTRRGYVEVFYGPAAKACCYEVQDDFLPNIEDVPWGSKTIKKQNGKTVFDLSGFTTFMLNDAGISSKAIETKFHNCTICNHQFFSYRRQGASAGRQMMVASLQ